MANVVNIDRYDRMSFQETKNVCPDLIHLERDGAAKLGMFPEILEDTFGALYKYSPELLEEVPNELQPNKEIMKQLMETREYRDMREFTRLQSFESALAVHSFSQFFLNKLPKDVKDKMNELSEARDELEKAQQSVDVSNAADAGAVKELQNKVDSLAQAAMEYLGENSSKVRMTLRNAAKKAMGDAQDAQQVVNSFGNEPGKPCNLPLGEKVSLAKKLLSNNKMRRIAEMAGRFQRMALYKQSTKTKHGFDEIVDVEQGADLSRVVPSEFLMMDDEDLDDVFLRKFVSKQLLQFKMEGKDREAQGPIIICIDNSASMAGHKEAWSKAFALGLLTIARKQKRAFAIVHFGSRGQLQTYEFGPDNGSDPARLLSALETFFNGGTNFQSPLEESIRLIAGGKHLKKADIIFVTDGICDLDEGFAKKFAEFKKENGVSVYGVVVPPGYDNLPFKCEAIIKTDLSDDKFILDTIYGQV